MALARMNGFGHNEKKQSSIHIVALFFSVCLFYSLYDIYPCDESSPTIGLKI